jgi:hypothetical protein
MSDTTPHQDSFDLFSAPPARSTDPDTSRAAAVAIVEAEGVLRPGTQCARLLAVFADAPDGGYADFEAAERAGLYRAHVCYWHRVGDLVRAGLIDDTGERRRNPDTNKERRVAAITAAGRAEAARLARLGAHHAT